MKKTTVLIKGPSKNVYETDKPGSLMQVFVSEIASGGKKHNIIGRAEANNTVGSVIFQFLESYHVPTYFQKKVNAKEMAIKQVDRIPVQVAVWNIASGSLSSRFNVRGGAELSNPILEFYLQDEKKKDQLINEYHAQALGIATQDEIRALTRLSLKINAVLKSFFLRRDLILADFTLVFGRYKGGLVLADEVNAETCQVLDRDTGDVFGPTALNGNLKDTQKKYDAFVKRLTKE